MPASSADRGADLSRVIAIARASRRCVGIYGHVDDLLLTADGSALRLSEQVASDASSAGVTTMVASETEGLVTRTPPPSQESVLAGPAPLEHLIERAVAHPRGTGQRAILLLRNVHAVVARDEHFGERLRDLPFDPRIARSGLHVVATFREPVAPAAVQDASGWTAWDITLPGLEERRAALDYWTRIGAVLPATLELAEVAALTGGLELDEVRRLIAEHAGYAPLTPHRISEVRATALRRQLGDMLHVSHHPEVSFADVVGGDAFKSMVRLARREQRYPPIALIGPPGVGKTMLATAAAHELSVPIVYVDGQLKGGIVGDTARNLARFRELLIAYAPVVAFWDEIDLLIGRSTDYNGDSGASNEVRQAVLRLLQDAPSLGVFVVASCNSPLSGVQFRVRNRMRLIPVLHPVGDEVLAIARLEARKLKVTLAPDAEAVFTATDGLLWNGRDIAKMLDSARTNILRRTVSTPPGQVVLTEADLRPVVRSFAMADDAAAELNALEAVYVTDNPLDLPWFAPATSASAVPAVPRYLRGMIGDDGIPDRRRISARLTDAGVRDAR